MQIIYQNSLVFLITKIKKNYCFLIRAGEKIKRAFVMKLFLCNNGSKKCRKKLAHYCKISYAILICI